MRTKGKGKGYYHSLSTTSLDCVTGSCVLLLTSWTNNLWKNEKMRVNNAVPQHNNKY